MLISSILKKRRQKSKKTVLGIDINGNGVAISNLIYDGDSYHLDFLDFIEFEQKFKSVSTINPHSISKEILDSIKISKNAKKSLLGLMGYSDLDILSEKVNIKYSEMKSLNNRNLKKYILDNHLSEKLPETPEKDIYFYCEELDKEYDSNKFYYMVNQDLMNMYKSLEKSLKNKISVLTTDIEAIESFIQNFYLNEIKNKNKHIFLGIYQERFSFYTLLDDKVVEHEVFSFSHSDISNSEYIEEIVPYILKILDLSSLDFNMDSDFMFSDNEEEFEETKTELHIFGTHDDLKEIVENLTDFISCDYSLVDVSKYFIQKEEINKSYRYVMSLGLATMLEA